MAPWDLGQLIALLRDDSFSTSQKAVLETGMPIKAIAHRPLWPTAVVDPPGVVFGCNHHHSRPSSHSPTCATCLFHRSSIVGYRSGADRRGTLPPPK